ncbi:pentatricopeptide repeat-containing protein At1g59720, chloroplastic/mitochondrial [Andrographis paniculata]|uniref:pentatricopeptide repeat-containing protein At1g59720, chloroplastic/mitochondrial n=1 Tax=Andrographis paniculata TaxID=175694 RepID=UPI0021E7F52C|nr:pentatricopeptide repeat-containing protein At1g59720, chloroplastic/mitochondrial [Andrographis paniculata]
MAAVLVTAPAADVSAVQLRDSHRRLLHVLTQSRGVSMPHLKQIHGQILRTGSAIEDCTDTFYLYSRLIHFSSLQDVRYAEKIFSQIANPNTFMYNILIRGYAHSKDLKSRAFPLFRNLLEEENLLPDKHTFPFVLKACAYLFSLIEGKQAHAQFLKRGFGPDVYVNNSLIHFYASCGCSESARKVFDKMPDRSLVSWNAIIDALVQLGEFDEALKRFVELMESSSFHPDGYTLQSVIDASTGIGALSMGIWAHAFILKRCIIDTNFDVLVSNSLIEMYCKCGALRMAAQVFEGMSRRDVNSWNAMILGLAGYGEAERVFEHFNRMIDVEKLLPNSVTFVGVLSACSHRGLVNDGRQYFNLMVTEYNIEPVLQHYGCLIDLLARNGRIDEALDVVSGMPMKPDAVIWRCILDASCRNSVGTLDSSEEIARKIISEEGANNSGVYVLLSRVYASADKWDDVGLVRRLMTEKGVAKEPGCSSVEINGVVHEFFAGDTTHPWTNEIYRFLDVIDEKLKVEGYAPDFSQAPFVGEADGKAQCLRLHSERLAIAYGLLNSKHGDTIRVFKNLRVCKDCHSFSKLVSKVFDVEIIMRDRLRFHRFKNGQCSCMDFW